MPTLKDDVMLAIRHNAEISMLNLQCVESEVDKVFNKWREIAHGMMITDEEIEKKSKKTKKSYEYCEASADGFNEGMSFFIKQFKGGE